MKVNDIFSNSVFIRTKIPSLFDEAAHSAERSDLFCLSVPASADNFLISESNPLYTPYNQQSGCKKSFHLSEYIFTSNMKKLFFDVNLFYVASVAHIWYTAIPVMRLQNEVSDKIIKATPRCKTVSSNHGISSSTADFFAPYRDSDGDMLCFYRPDFVIEMNDGCFYIVEITDERTASKRIIQAKKKYIEKNNISASGVHISYVSIPIRRADILLEDFIRIAPL